MHIYHKLGCDIIMNEKDNKEVNFIKRVITTIVASTLLLPVNIIAASETDSQSIPDLKGKIIYHTYSSYTARDSKLYMVDLDNGTQVCLNEDFEDAVHTMNGSFSPDGESVVFMGITNRFYGEEWDIFLYNLQDKFLINLTKNNGYRNEDPKFSPDGKFVVYKQGYWSAEQDRMVFDIWELELETKKTRQVTNNLEEESMPYYSTDGEYIYYMKGEGGSSEICEVDRRGEEYGVKTIFKEEGVQSYYPITYKDKVYFAKWHEPSNTTDMLIILDEDGKRIPVSFNNIDYNVSDSYPISDELVIFSGTTRGTIRGANKGGYDLYLGDILTGQVWSMDEYANINDNRHQLGVSYFIKEVEQ